MKVVFISNRKNYSKQEELAWFKSYCESSDLFVFSEMQSAKDFIANQAIEKQKHIDFVITDWDFVTDNAKTILSWLRSSSENYSARNFQLRSIPVLLIEDITNQSSYIGEGFDAIVEDFPNDANKLKSSIKNAIKKWRYSLANDLDLIGLDPKTQKNYIGHRSAFISYYRLMVLSREFVDSKSKKLNYIWTNSEIKTLHRSNEMFLNKMRSTMRNPPKFLEKEFHDFFRSNPTFIKGEDFLKTKEEMLYEKHFYKDGTRKYDEPDFVNKPYEYALRNPEIFEIKRQSQKIIRYHGEKFIVNAKKSFEQVKRYKTYMNSDNPLNQYYIKRYLGYLPDAFEFTLLMGSMNEKQEHEDLIERLKSDFDFGDINLVTYEELLEKHIRLCNRLDDFTIF